MKSSIVSVFVWFLSITFHTGLGIVFYLTPFSTPRNEPETNIVEKIPIIRIPLSFETVTKSKRTLKNNTKKPSAQLPAEDISTLRENTTNDTRKKSKHIVTSTVISQPMFADNPPPEYPRLARRFGYEGRVIISVTISAEGTCTHSIIKKSSGYPILDKAAQKAVRKWKFIPAKKNSHFVESTIDIPIRFTLTP